MSVKAMSAAFDTGDQLNLSAVDRLILLRLGDWADDFGYCWPGIDDLVAKVGVDARTIQRHLAALEGSELIARVVVGGGRHRSTLYRMLPKILTDSKKAPGRLRYQARFGIEIKGDILSGFQPLELGVAGTEKVTPDAEKPRHSSVTRSVIIHEDPSEIDFNLQAKSPRLPGESPTDYFKRLTELP